MFQQTPIVLVYNDPFLHGRYACLRTEAVVGTKHMNMETCFLQQLDVAYYPKPCYVQE